MLSLVTAWLVSIAATLAVCHRLDTWSDEEAAASFYRRVASPLLEDPLRWLHSVSGAFLQLFDRFYRRSDSTLNDLLWHAILFCYPAFLLSRGVLAGFSIAKPSTELMLITTLVVTVLLALMLGALLTAMRIWENSSSKDLYHTLWTHRSESIKLLLLGMASLYGAVCAASLIIHGIGPTFKNITALSVGAALAFPVALGVALIPRKTLVVSPLCAAASSLFFLVVLALALPTAAKSFWVDLDLGAFEGASLAQTPDVLVQMIPAGRAPVIGTLAFVAYNLFADAISLVETRWILQLSIGKSFRRLLALLGLDLVLSAAIYLLLPLIAGQDTRVLFDAVTLGGSRPWLGILFWSTFATSLVFYLFVLATAAIAIASPLLRLVHWLGGFFAMADKPLRAIGIAMVLFETLVFGCLTLLVA